MRTCFEKNIQYLKVVQYSLFTIFRGTNPSAIIWVLMLFLPFNFYQVRRSVFLVYFSANQPYLWCSLSYIKNVSAKLRRKPVKTRKPKPTVGFRDIENRSVSVSVLVSRWALLLDKPD
jgi:hypothetical protein